MILPFSNYRYITSVMVLSSVLLVVALMILGDYSSTMLWLNWLVSLTLTAGVWNIVSRFRLEGGSDVRAFAIALPLLNVIFQFASYYLYHNSEEFTSCQIEILALLTILSLSMSLWQQKKCILEQLSIGLIIGICSTLVPQILFWILLIPICCYHMRCWSIRNALAAITGILLGIWIIYCCIFAIDGEAIADAMLHGYASLVPTSNYLPAIDGSGFWLYLYFGYVTILVISYGISGLFVTVGQTVRATSSVHLISSLCILFALLIVVDLQRMTSNICILSLLTSMQITIRQANSRSVAGEWAILLLIVLGTALCVLPFFFNF